MGCAVDELRFPSATAGRTATTRHQRESGNHHGNRGRQIHGRPSSTQESVCGSESLVNTEFLLLLFMMMVIIIIIIIIAKAIIARVYHGSYFSPDPKLHFIRPLSKSTVCPTPGIFQIYIVTPI